MNPKRCAAALWRRGARTHLTRRSAPAVSLIAAAALVAGFQGTATAAESAHAQRAAAAAPDASSSAPIYSTQLDFDNNGTAWSESYFAGLAADGLTRAELDMPWGTIEPSAGTFTFTEFDTELANAAAAGIELIPIFWQAGWGGSPAPWINDFEEGSGGATGAAPDWWNPTEQSEYFTYVEDTVKNAVAQAGGYGGAILDYGYLDAMWDLGGAGGGYTADDVAEFQNTYLPQTYGTIATFNSKYGTSYTAFSQVPAEASGQSLFGVFQAFRAWSVQTTYGALTAGVRAITASTPLFYYFGGGFGNATNYANNPDTFFELAKQYTVTIIDDDASSQGLTLTFGSLARAYGVQLMQEWTAPPSNSQLAAESVQWLSLDGVGLPNDGGEDFFIHDGTEKDTVGFPIYTAWIPTLKTLSGSYPQDPTAVYIDFSQAYGNTSGGSLNNVEGQLASLWLDFQAGFTVVTSQEVANGAVSLSSFKAILPLNGVDTNLTSYQSGGGTLLTSEQQLTGYITPYAQLDSSGILQTVPSVASSHTSAQLVLGDINSSLNYDDTVQFNPAGLGLNSGSYYLVNNTTGAAVPQTVQSNGDVCATAAVNAATLQEWTIQAGSPPSGTPSSSCPANSGVDSTSVTTNATTNTGTLQFLGLGQTNSGADGNLTQLTQSGQAAVESWTSSQSGAGDANIYLQNDPVSAVEAASTVTVQVTYWATAGQGFTVQYDSPGNAYLNGPTVTSPGTGTWTTASVQLTNVQFNELQNYGADLRLNVTNAADPLIVQNVTISSASSTSPTLTASPSSLSFGNEQTGSSTAAQSVTVSNTGGAAAAISSITVPSGFAQTNTCGSALAVGGSCTVSVTFTPSASQSYSGNLTVNSNAGDNPLNVALSGAGISSTTNLTPSGTVTASSSASGYPPSNANDGNTSTYWESLDGAAYPQTLTANLGKSYSLGSVTLTLPPATDWSTRTETFSVLGSTNGSTWTTVVASAGYTFNPASGNMVAFDLPSNSNYQYLELSFTGNTGWSAAQVSEFEIYPASGSGGGTSATLSASPSSVSFGSENTGSTSAAQNVTISNTGNASATISGISTAAPFAETNTCGATLAAGATCTAAVTFAPTAAQSYNGSLSIASNATNSTLTIALTGTGTSSNTNLALNQPVTASSYTQNYAPANAVDGNTSTYWESNNGAWPVTFTVNLGASKTLGNIVIDVPPSTAWQTRTQTLSVLGSTNNTTWTTLVASATYTWNPSTGNTVSINLPSGTTDQYLELNFTANNVQNGAQVSELEIFG